MKRLFGIVVVFFVFFFAGIVMAQMDPGPYHILHKDGAVYNSDTGWMLSSPPYYGGADWVVDFTYNSQGMSILHKDGAIWNSSSGWMLSSPPYYAGSAYARAMEYLRDVRGCWAMAIVEYNTKYDPGEGVYELQREPLQFPSIYLNIQNQYGTRFEGQVVAYNPEDTPQCQYINVEGSIDGDQFTVVMHYLEGPPGDQCDELRIVKGLVTWNDIGGRWEIKGSMIWSDTSCQVRVEDGGFGVFMAWPETVCQCPPGE
jgi:hypothetical protein